MTETTMTDAERNAAAGGHPVGDCDDCGHLHTPWSAHFNEDGSAAFADPAWRQAASRAFADADPEGYLRVVVETSGDGGEPYERNVIARGDDAEALLIAAAFPGPPGYTLADCYALHVHNPDTFALPDPHLIRELRPGDFAKLVFIDDEGPAERMWVQVTEVRDSCTFAGALANDPAVLPLRHGDQVEFSASHIAGVQRGDGDAMTVTH